MNNSQRPPKALFLLCLNQSLVLHSGLVLRLLRESPHSALMEPAKVIQNQFSLWAARTQALELHLVMVPPSTNTTPYTCSLIDPAGNKRADNTKDDQNQNIQEGLDVKENPKWKKVVTVITFGYQKRTYTPSSGISFSFGSQVKEEI